MSTGLTTTITQEQREAKEVSKQVQARLDQADEFERAVESLTNTVSDKNEQIGKLQTQLKSLERLADKEAELDTRQSSLDTRASELDWKEKELDARKEIHELQVKMQETRVEDHKAIFSLMLRNTTIRRTGKIPVPVEGGSAQYGCDNNGNAIMGQNGGFVMDSDFEETRDEE